MLKQQDKRGINEYNARQLKEGIERKIDFLNKRLKDLGASHHYELKKILH